ncbi:MAG: hypothetical protein L3K26_09370 [Candidatus Hydrogenedentes bacterium]|nr:hypothetical protein [Candidatus Hydrogenedentota bacterium]
MTQDQYLQEIIASHFDPKWGAPYWLETRATLPFDPVRDIKTLSDLMRFPPFPPSVLRERPIEAMIPKAYHDSLAGFVTAETGGATGVPQSTAYHPADFHDAFVVPFHAAAKLLAFPKDRHWLYIGPSGPHVIGKAARACARAMDSLDPFTVDFDPRWVRKLAKGSLGHTRYLEHVLEQAQRVLNTQHIGVLFSTPPVLEVLGTRLSREVREEITGIHLGGMAASDSFWEQLTAAWFPNAVALSGYGNSLAGVCPQITPLVDGAPVYVPHGQRLILDVMEPDERGRGRVCFHRLDRACFLPHVVEGDEAEGVGHIAAEALNAGFHPLGIRDPRPMEQQRETRAGGLY